MIFHSLLETILVAFQSLQNTNQIFFSFFFFCCLNLSDHVIVTLRQSCNVQEADLGVGGSGGDPAGILGLWDMELSNPAVGLSSERCFVVRKSRMPRARRMFLVRQWCDWEGVEDDAVE